MTQITADQILHACPTAQNLDVLVPEINDGCAQHDISTPDRLAMFVAQCLHESGGFRYMHEIWGPTSWQLKYENNAGLGNNQPGDGHRFMGRGLIQLTGRSNYERFADWAADQSILTTPEIVAEPEYAVLSAIYFWTVNNLNAYADAQDIQGCTRRINGRQMLGLEERTRYYNSLMGSM